VVNTWGRGVFSRSDTPHLKVARSQRHPNFWHPYLRPYGLTQSDKIWYGNTCGEKRVSRVSHVPVPRGQGLSVFKIVCLVHVHTVRETATKFCLVIKLDVKKIFTCPLPWPKFLVTRMLTHDLFAAANLLVL